jgi:hypothetical protein
MSGRTNRASRLIYTLLAVFGFLVALPCAAFAFSSEREVTAKYVKRYPDDFSIHVTKEKNGLISFEIKHDVPRPMYHVAHLAIYRKGELIAETSTPSFGKKHDNTFYFSVASEFISETKFDFSDSGFAEVGDDAIPLPGTITYRFRLLDFVPKDMLESAKSK